jgi:hypothetical protein
MIKIPGVEFNRLLKPPYQTTSEYLDEMVREQDLWTGMLPDDDTDFLVDLTGEWTLCTLPYSYSIFIGDYTHLPVFARTKKWEQSLRKVLPSCEIIRLDDYLLEPWQVKYDYLLVRHPQAVEEFVEWLHTQDNRYWIVLPKSPMGADEKG